MMTAELANEFMICAARLAGVLAFVTDEYGAVLPEAAVVAALMVQRDFDLAVWQLTGRLPE